MSLLDTTVHGNQAGYVGGGGISNAGTLEVANSTISNNLALAFFGELMGSCGGIDNAGTMTVRNSTISGNHSVRWGGGICNEGTAEIRDSTIVLNGSYQGTGIHNAGRVMLRNTIVAGQAIGWNCGGDPILSLGYNLADDGTCALDAEGDRPYTDPLLAPLGDYGGPTATHALYIGSPAIDAGSCPATGTGAADQRSFPRPVNLPNAGRSDAPDADDGCDIGSVEVEPAPNMGGVQGTVYGVGGAPLAAEISFEGLPDVVATDCSGPGACTGGYHQWLVAGSYSMTVSAPGYPSQSIAIEIQAEEIVTQDVFLARYLYLPIVIK
jgi:hypothetical protein